MMKKKGYAKGAMMKKKGMAKGGLKMVMKNGKKVPFYAADGKGKMYGGGMAMKKKGMAKGGMKKKGMAKGGLKKMARGGFLAPAARPLKKRTKGGAKGGKK
tara:strand:- start:1018 stop:1320 length:303 start_codon:yes stop_codon:yes gene_type:complete